MSEPLPAHTPRFRFPQTHRLKSPDEFQAVYQLKKSASDAVLIVYAGPNGLGHPRLGVSVSKKVGNAVTRNRYKRLFREAFRLSQHVLPPGVDLIVIPRPSPREPSQDQVRQSLVRLAEQAAHRLTRTPEFPSSTEVAR
ncbi:MAG: ribonuclease P protein component [Bacteroidales bacterium]|nr:ribonuclease P protein component [Bacteroidales bacterium]